MQVVPLDLAQKLIEAMKAAGIEVPEGENEYISFDNGEAFTLDSVDRCNDLMNDYLRDHGTASTSGDNNFDEIFAQVIVTPTFTLDEMLFRVLPKHIRSPEVTDREAVMSCGGYLHSRILTPYYIHYYSKKYGILEGSSISIIDNPPCDACAKLMLWLIEHKHVSGSVE
jgi:hypothetical protein